MLTIDDLSLRLSQNRWRTWRLIWSLKPLMQPLCTSDPGQPFLFDANAVGVLRQAKTLVASGVAHRDLLAAMSADTSETASALPLELVG